MASNTAFGHYDVIVLGVGSMGSAACWFLARRGQKVLGLEQFNTPHENGSHAGQSRIIRKALVQRTRSAQTFSQVKWKSFVIS